MTDSRLRELERRFRETGAIEDEAALLLTRERTGQLQYYTVELCAYLGYEPARLAFGCKTLDDPLMYVPCGEWVGAAASNGTWAWGLATYGQKISVAAGLAVASSVAALRLADYDMAEIVWADDLPAGAIDAAARWMGCPCLPCATNVGVHTVNIADGVWGIRNDWWTRLEDLCDPCVIDNETPLRRLFESASFVTKSWGCELCVKACVREELVPQLLDSRLRLEATDVSWRLRTRRYLLSLDFAGRPRQQPGAER